MRGNHKERELIIKTLHTDEASFWFYRWIEKHNEKKCKAYANVNILACDCIGVQMAHCDEKGRISLDEVYIY